MATPTSSENFWFRNRENQIRRNYGLQHAQNRFEYGTQQQFSKLDRGNLVEQFARQRRQLPGQYSQRGLLNSGIYQQGLSEYAADRTRGLNRFDLSQGRQAAQYQLTDQQLATIRDSALNDLQAQKAAFRRDLATQLSPWRNGF